jgi:hypothetical protein
LHIKSAFKMSFNSSNKPVHLFFAVLVFAKFFFSSPDSQSMVAYLIFQYFWKIFYSSNFQFVAVLSFLLPWIFLYIQNYQHSQKFQTNCFFGTRLFCQSFYPKAFNIFRKTKFNFLCFFHFFADHVLELSRQSENKTLNLFSQVYRKMSPLSRQPILELYKSIRRWVYRNYFFFIQNKILYNIM